MRNRNLFIPLLGTLMIHACTTSQIKIESNPEGATVKVAQGLKTSHSVGVTPLTLTSSNAPELFRAPLQITVEKEGYESHSVFIPQTSVSSTGDLSITLTKEAKNNLNATVNAVAQVQRLIFKKDYSGAENLLSTQINSTPSLAILHSLQGNVFYLQKRLNEALSSYQQADRLEPNNLEVAKMISKLKSFHVAQEKN